MIFYVNLIYSLCPPTKAGSRVEGFGISYIEAARAGLPAIAGNTGGASEAVLDGETGWCVDATDARIYAPRAFFEALTSKRELSRRGKLAQNVFYRRLKARLFSLASSAKPVSMTPYSNKKMIMTQKYPWLLPLLLSPLGLIIPLAPRSGSLFVLLLGVAGIAHCIRRRPSFRWLLTPPVYAMGAFLSYLFLTSFWSTVPERSVEQAFRLTLLALFGLAGFSMLRSLTTHRNNASPNA